MTKTFAEEGDGMKKKTNEQRIKELEARIEELERRPPQVYIPQPYPVYPNLYPYYPSAPFYPWTIYSNSSDLRDSPGESQEGYFGLLGNKK